MCVKLYGTKFSSFVRVEELAEEEKIYHGSSRWAIDCRKRAEAAARNAGDQERGHALLGANTALGASG